MRVRVRGLVASVGLVLLMTVLLGSASAQSDTQAAVSGCGATVLGGGAVSFTTPGQLKTKECRTLRGKKLKDGCKWDPPELVLGPDEQAVEARQVSADFSTCTTVVEDRDAHRHRSHIGRRACRNS